MISSSTAVRILLIAYVGLGALAVYGAIICVVRDRILRRFHGYPPERTRAFAGTLRRTVALLRPVLLAGPFCLFLTPLILQLYAGIPMLHPLIIATLLYLNLLEAYAFRVWLTARLDPSAPGSSRGVSSRADG